MMPAERAERLQRFTRLSEWPLAVLALAVVPALLFDDHTQYPAFHRWAETLNWIVWIAFCGELAMKAWLIPDKRAFFRHAWLDLAIVICSPPFFGPEYLQGVRVFRAVRLLRFMRVLRVLAVAGIALESARDVLQHRRLHNVAIITVVIVSLGACAIYGVEHGHNKSIASIGDAFWWAIVTATTVGYGDISPVTTEGRLIAVALMLVGIGFIGVFTATIASYFFGQDKQDFEDEFTRLDERLARLEQKQDELLALIQTRVF